MNAADTRRKILDAVEANFDAQLAATKSSFEARRRRLAPPAMSAIALTRG
jgi:hypothetical protein